MNLCIFPDIELVVKYRSRHLGLLEGAEYLRVGKSEGRSGAYFAFLYRYMGQEGAARCTVSYFIVLHDTALYCTALYCTALHCTVVYCTELHFTSLCCAL